MNRLVQTVLTVVWGLWLGGLVTLLITVPTLFNKTFPLDHDLAGQAASGIFHQFNEYRLIVAAAALLLTAAGWLQERTRGKMAIFVLLALASIAAVSTAAVFTPRIDQFRLDKLTHTADFARIHGLSMGIYALETILVFTAGLILPNTIRRPTV